MFAHHLVWRVLDISIGWTWIKFKDRMEKHRPTQPRGIQTVDDLASCKPTINGINPNISERWINLDLVLHHNLYTPPRKKAKSAGSWTQNRGATLKLPRFIFWGGNISVPLCFLSPFIFIWWYQGVLRRVILSIALLSGQKWLTLSFFCGSRVPLFATWDSTCY